MAASVGLPTRIAVGYSYGTPEDGDVATCGTRTRTRGPRCTSPASAGSRSSRRRAAARTAQAAPAIRPSGPMCRPKRRARRHRRPRRHPAAPTPPTRSPRADRNSATSKRAAARRDSTSEATSSSDSSSSVLARHRVWCCSCSPCSARVLVVARVRAARGGVGTRADPRDRVLGAWAQALDHLADAGVEPKPSATPVEFALRHAPAHGAGAAGPALMELAQLQTAALFAPDAPTDRRRDRRGCRWTRSTARIGHQISAFIRWRRRLDPRRWRPPTTSPRRLALTARAAGATKRIALRVERMDLGLDVSAARRSTATNSASCPAAQRVEDLAVVAAGPDA